MTQKPDPTAFMERIASLDESNLTPRDLRILDSVIRNPGQCGTDVVSSLRLPGRSSIQANFLKLIRYGIL